MRVFCFFISLLLSCIDPGKTVIESTGKNSEILFVVEDFIWEESIKKLSEQTFGLSIEGLNKDESLFSITHVSPKEFNRLLRSHKNIIFVLKEGESQSVENKWASKQLVEKIIWSSNEKKTTEELLQIRNRFVSKELKLLQNSFLKNSQKKIEERLKFNFGCDFLIPQKYQVIKNEKNLFWANYDPQNTDEIKNIIIYSFEPETINIQNEILEKTDSVFARYLLGEKDGSHVQIEDKYPPYYFEGVYRGLWKLENGFMGGPFIIKTYLLEHKVVVSIGLVFDPRSRKREHIKVFEAIL